MYLGGGSIACRDAGRVALVAGVRLAFMVRRNSADTRLARFISQIDPYHPAGNTPVCRRAAPSSRSGRSRTRCCWERGAEPQPVLLWCAFARELPQFIGQWSSWSTTIFKD